jgi:hypothetical protein
MSAWGKPIVTAKDMIIPKILPLQYMSEKVKDKQGEYGEFRDTLDNRLLGDLATPFEVVPFLLQKKWIEFEMVAKRGGGMEREFLQVIPIQDDPTKAGFNDDLPLRTEDGKIERDRVMDFFVLIPEDIQKGESFPYVLSFRRTSLKAGQKLATQLYVRNLNAGKVPPATVMLISAKTKENDHGTFVVQDVEAKRPSTEKELQEAFKWFKIVQAGNVKVDESEFKAEEKVSNAAEETEF